ncbi:MAG: helix-turn-helix transcriptional regulator [Alphaproteobacteria bacterium]|nr:helix-turn-helix transcriptional regulator [Alphaproteobacteria bacterium]
MPARADTVDAHVGKRVRLRRTLLGLSQEKLGEALSLTFQQVQKYERGTNRISASRLLQLSKVLNVPIDFFFDDLSVAGGARDNAQSAYEGEELSRRETLELVRAYYRIGDPAVRRRFYELLKTMGEGESRSLAQAP